MNDAHPEARCQKCSGPNFTDAWALAPEFYNDKADVVVNAQIAAANGELHGELDRLTRCLSEASIPAGWKLVPVEPTKEMLDAVKAWPAHWNRDDPEWGQRQVAAFEADRMAATSSYQLMLDAAPEAPK